MRPEITKVLDFAAEGIREAADYNSREFAIDEFKSICRDAKAPINAEREANRRGVSLMNHLELAGLHPVRLTVS